MSKPLEGIRVLDLTTFVAAPVCARMLGDLGAEVIKIEPPKGDAWRIAAKAFNPTRFSDDMNPIFDICNTGKKLISINLKSEEGMQIFHKLLETTDVFVTNNRPEALKRLGISYEDLKDKYPRLVYAMVLGYGEKGPDANTPAFGVTAFWARSGFLRDMALTDGEYQPLMPPSGAGDTITGTTLTMQICAALIGRERTGKGDFVRSCLYQNGLFVFGTMSMATQQPGGKVYPRSRNAGGSAGAIAGTYCCADNEWVFLASGGDPAYLPKIYNMIGHPELIGQPDPADLTELLGIFREEFGKKTRAQWLQLSKEFDVPMVPVNHFNEAVMEEQAMVNGFVEKVAYPHGDAIMMPTTPFIMDSLEKRPVVPTHTAGWDTEEVLLELGYSAEQISQMAATGSVSLRKD